MWHDEEMQHLRQRSPDDLVLRVFQMTRLEPLGVRVEGVVPGRLPDGLENRAGKIVVLTEHCANRPGTLLTPGTTSTRASVMFTRTS